MVEDSPDIMLLEQVRREEERKQRKELRMQKKKELEEQKKIIEQQLIEASYKRETRQQLELENNRLQQ